MHPFNRLTKRKSTRRRHEERDLHKACVQFLRYSLPDNVYFFHPANGGSRHAAEAQHLKDMGVTPGTPDLVFCIRGRFVGIELKTGSRKLSPAQQTTHTDIILAGGLVTTVNSLEALEAFLGQLIDLKASLTANAKDTQHAAHK